MKTIDEDFITKAVLAQYHILNCESQKYIPGWGKIIRKTLTLKGQSYFLKEKVPYLSSKEFITKITIHNALKLNKGPVSTLITTRDKKPYAKFSNRYFELHKWIPGRFINYNCMNEIDILGIYTGVLTKKLKILYQNQVDNIKLPFPKAKAQCFPDTINSIKHYFHNLFLLYPIKTEFQVILSTLYKIVNKVIYFINWKDLPESIIHGDLSSDNAIFNLQSNNITFIDFDDMSVSKRIWDIARLAAMIGSLYDNKLDRKQLNTEFAYDKVKVLLAGYTRNCRLNQIEKNNFTHIVIINLVLIFLSEFDIDDLESNLFSKETICMEFEKLLKQLYSLLKNKSLL